MNEDSMFASTQRQNPSFMQAVSREKDRLEALQASVNEQLIHPHTGNPPGSPVFQAFEALAIMLNQLYGAVDELHQRLESAGVLQDVPVNVPPISEVPKAPCRMIAQILEKASQCEHMHVTVRAILQKLAL